MRFFEYEAWALHGPAQRQMGFCVCVVIQLGLLQRGHRAPWAAAGHPSSQETGSFSRGSGPAIITLGDKVCASDCEQGGEVSRGTCHTKKTSHCEQLSLGSTLPRPHRGPPEMKLST